MSLADEILAFNDRPAVEVEAWGKKLWIQPISGTERDAFDAERVAAADGDGNVAYWRARYLVRCLFDAPDGNRVFTDEQAVQLAHKNGETIKRLWNIAADVNGAGPGAVTAAAKNS